MRICEENEGTVRLEYQITRWHTNSSKKEIKEMDLFNVLNQIKRETIWIIDFFEFIVSFCVAMFSSEMNPRDTFIDAMHLQFACLVLDYARNGNMIKRKYNLRNIWFGFSMSAMQPSHPKVETSNAFDVLVCLRAPCLFSAVCRHIAASIRCHGALFSPQRTDATAMYLPMHCACAVPAPKTETG